MERQRKAPAVAGAPRKRKKQGPDGSAGASDPASQASSPPGAKKPRLAGPKGKASKADKAHEDGDEPVAKEEAAEEVVAQALGKVHTGVFSKDLPWLMYGFGDADKPLKETVELVEEIAVQYITDTVHGAMRAAAARSAAAGSSGAGAARKDELKLEDLLYAVRHDPRKVARIQELIRRQQEIKDARRVYEKMDGMPNEEDMPEI